MIFWAGFLHLRIMTMVHYTNIIALTLITLVSINILYISKLVNAKYNIEIIL